MERRWNNRLFPSHHLDTAQQGLTLRCAKVQLQYVLKRDIVNSADQPTQHPTGLSVNVEVVNDVFALN